jgi:microcystin-dependent protein
MTTRIKTFGGNIGIGTDDPGSFRLNVNGDIKADSLIINDVTNSQVPIGLIAPWYGTVESIPTGWVLCDGATGITRSDGSGTINTPDLREKFIRGATSTPQVGQTAGNNTVTLSEANLPGHTHTFTSADGGLSHQHTLAQKNTPHSHGENVAQSNAPHTHTAQNANMNHLHVLDLKNVPHAHNNPASEGSFNGSHNHGDTPTVESEHDHYIEHRYASPGGSSSIFANRTRIHSPSTGVMNTGSHNMPHGHNAYDQKNAPHTHTTEPVSVPHRHETSPGSAAHDHGNTGVATQVHGHSIQVNNNAVHSHTTQTNTSTAHAHTGTTDSTGQETAITITNPYYLLAYIMKI